MDYVAPHVYSLSSPSCGSEISCSAAVEATRILGLDYLGRYQCARRAQRDLDTLKPARAAADHSTPSCTTVRRYDNLVYK